MRVLIACEFSGVVRRAFRELGHDAWSCDVLPSEDNSPYHYQCDVMDVLPQFWDMMIAHPPCTYLCNSGVRWLYTETGRMDKMYIDAKFFMALYNAPIKKICIENPIPHSFALLPPYTQIVQPWMFGHGETKATCLWLKGLPKLVPTNVVSGRVGRIHKMAPSKNRSKERSRTYTGIATAMATQWSS